MKAQTLEKDVKKVAVEFGLKDGNAIVRSNITSESFKKGGAYFGYIRPEEASSGVYYDVSFVIFPQEEGRSCIVAIVVGSAGFQRDYDLVSTPSLRRLYKRLTTADGSYFFKNDFTNIESVIPELRKALKGDLADLEEAVKLYGKCILAASVIDLTSECGFPIISAWLAQYAQLRGWGDATQRENQKQAINRLIGTQSPVDIERDIRDLLRFKRFVVLQGAPGTGKTYNALKVSQDYQETHLIQFHAETSYTDFVGGIRPVLYSDQLKYEAYDGKLVEAIKAADKVSETGGRVLLIIDEINRANLANVLGPVFFLFETHVGERSTPLQVGTLSLSKLPDNLDVIATMNTAAWYTIRPQAIVPKVGQTFHKDLFREFCDIFERYASDEELNLQPGPSYFLTDAEENKQLMKMRLIYELMPLIKEYLAEGLLQKAADSFAHLFYTEAGVYLYE